MILEHLVTASCVLKFSHMLWSVPGGVSTPFLHWEYGGSKRLSRFAHSQGGQVKSRFPVAVHCCSLHSASSPVCNPYLTDGGFKLRDFPALGPLRGWLTGDGAWLLDSNAFQRLTLNQPVNEALGETSSSASPGFLKQFWTQQEAWQIKQTKSHSP